MKKLTFLLTASFLASLFFSPILSLAQDTDPHMTGLIERTTDEVSYETKTRPRLKKIRHNKIGITRINRHRMNKGRAAIRQNPVAIGQEIETVIGETTPQAAEAAETAAPDALPSSVDNSTLKYFPPIRSQGSLASCGSFSGTYYVMTYMYALANDLDAKNGGDTYRMSPKWTYNMVNDGANAGSWYYWCYAIGVKNGVANWSEFPYDGSDYKSWCLVPQVWKNSLYRRFDQYGYISNTGEETGINQVKEMLANGYILNYATYINSWQYKNLGNDPATSADNTYAGQRCCYYTNGTNGYHAMTVVGYNDDIWVDINGNSIVDNGEKGAFRVANSWGTGWGQGGFMWLAYDAVRNTSKVSGWDTSTRKGSIWGVLYWLTAKKNYSPKIIAQFTVNHAKRNQMGIFLGVSDPSNSTPETLAYQNMLYLQGGAYAFNGSATAIDGTFYLDFTDLAPGSGITKKYYLGGYDSAANDPLTLKSYQITDLTADPPTTTGVNPADLPQTIDNQKAYASVSYQYGADNTVPVAIISAAPATGYSPLEVSFSGSGSYDPDGSIVSYNWDFGDGTSASGINVTHVYSRAGDFTACLTVTDDLNGKNTSSTLINVQNGSPVAVITATPTSGRVPATISFSSSSSYDPLHTITDFSWSFGDRGTSNLQNPVYTYTSPGEYLVVLTVTNNVGLTANTSINISVTAANRAPVITQLPAKSTNEGTALKFNLSAGDPDGDVLTYTAANLPAGAALNATTGEFSWTPGYTQSGTYPVTFTATDPGKLSSSTSTNITVSNVNRAPVLSPIGSKSVKAGSALSFAISATDPDQDRLTYAAANLPQGATFNLDTKTFSWTPGTNTQTGAYRVTFSVSDGSLSASETVTITVETTVITAPANLTAIANSPTKVTLNWSYQGNGTTIYIERSTSSGGTFSVVGTTSAGNTTFANMSLTQGTTYYYRVRAGASGKYSVYSNIANVTTPIITAPVNLTASAASPVKITLNWSYQGNGTTIYIERSTSSGGTFSMVGTTSAGTTTFTNMSLTPGTVYYYRIRAGMSGVYSVYSNVVSVTTPIVIAPTNLTVKAAATNRASLTWSYQGNGTTIYIERSTGSGGTFSMIGTTSAGTTTFTNMSLIPGTVYYYRIRAGLSGKYSAYSNVANITIAVPAR